VVKEMVAVMAAEAEVTEVEMVMVADGGDGSDGGTWKMVATMGQRWQQRWH
jgi:hypothetical protein